MAEKRVILGILILVAVVGAVFLFYTFSKNPLNTAGVINNPDENENSNALQVTVNDNANNAGDVIEITSSGFTPSTLTVSKGDTVTWINMDTEPHWPASALHPTHTIYPGSDIEKCGTSEESTIFDACKGIAPGESFSFTFNEEGSWSYHDHINLGLFGKIVVQ